MEEESQSRPDWSTAKLCHGSLNKNGTMTGQRVTKCEKNSPRFIVSTIIISV